MEWYAVREDSKNNSDDVLMHYGILGMKWGVRRYQNADGTWTAEGRKRYGNPSDNRLSSRLYNKRGNSDSAPKTGVEIKNGMFRNEHGKIQAVDKNGNYTDEYVDAARREAFDNNKYNANFLTAVGNYDYVLEDRETTLKEYEKYLMNPKTYTPPTIIDYNSSNNNFTKEYKEAALRLAKNKDKFNLDFLEIVQNDERLFDDTPSSKKLILSEYEKFLNNTQDYWDKHVNEPALEKWKAERNKR